jgi:recombinational DNA repair protein (RecF pathway)
MAFDKLAVARSQNPPPPFSARPLVFYAVCGAFSDLILRLLRPGIADPRIFELCRELIQTCASVTDKISPGRTRLLYSAAALRLLDLLGFAPLINRAGDDTTPVASLALASFMRQATFGDVLSVTATTDILAAASDFVDEALKQTHLEREPHGAATIRELIGAGSAVYL